ncbi:MAG: 4Fe-4S dicluster domain-containing protein [Armatimonadetes bacterium]|nr:4Fe-4S dicluster domain-containing protein [Armatimonadota bacterium]
MDFWDKINLLPEKKVSYNLKDREKEIMPALSIKEREGNFKEVELGLSEEQAKREAMRCLTCDVGLCVGCKICAEVCPNYVIYVETQTNPQGRDFTVKYDLDLTRCLFCGLCMEACPTNTIKMTNIYELAEYSKENLYLDKEKLTEV